MYFFTAMTTLRPVHRDGVNIFLISQELASAKLIAYPIGLPSIENLFFLVQKSALYINFYGATIGYIGLIFSTLILKPFLEKQGLNLFVILNSILFLGPISIFRIGNTTISIIIPLFLALLLVFYNRIVNKKTSNFYSLIILITMTFSLIAPHVLISILPFIVLFNIIYYIKFRSLMLIYASVLISMICISSIYIQSKIYGTNLIDVATSSFAVLNSAPQKPTHLQISAALITDLLSQKGPIQLPSESLFILGLYLIFILTVFWLAYGIHKKNDFLLFFSLFNIFLLTSFLLGIGEMTALKGRIAYFIFLLFTFSISYYLRFLKFQKIITFCTLGTVSILNSSIFFNEDLLNRDTPYKLSFNILENHSKQLIIYNQLDNLNYLYSQHDFQSTIRNDYLNYDYLFLDLDKNLFDFRYSGKLEIGGSIEDYNKKKKAYLDLRQVKNSKIIYQTRFSHDKISYVEDQYLILRIK
jgi:hypothetical protein